MMLTRLFFALCVGVMFVQAEVRRPEPRDIFSDVETLLKQLADDVEEQIRNAIDGLQELYDQIVSIAADIEQGIEEQLVAATKPFIDQINELSNQAFELGVDISECVVDSIDDISALPRQLLQDVSTCVGEKLEEGLGIINETISTVSSSIERVANLTSELSDCRQQSILTQIACAGSVGIKVGAAGIEIPAIIGKEVAEATVYVATFKAGLAVCTVGVADQLTLEATSIVADVVDCANDKFSGITTTAVPSPTTREPATTGAATEEPTEEPTTTSVEIPGQSTPGRSSTDTTPAGTTSEVFPTTSETKNYEKGIL
ncbi:uncharacterized protein LOC132698315 [Cylas formicarius]|uniref:uncharacterized protein LOC132698315 n=1 Tax=Cylas formicarius TaxID=197179 RepID=UPI0029584291|nr:uncharacterized protein LOC132698315 [Cylas formicarius]